MSISTLGKVVCFGASLCTLLVASAARTDELASTFSQPATAGIPLGKFYANNCGFFSDSAVAFRGTTNCPQGTTFAWDLPLYIDGFAQDHPIGTRTIDVGYSIGTPGTDAVRCRVKWRDLNGNLFTGAWKTASAAGTGNFNFHDGTSFDYAHWVSCEVKVGAPAAPNWLLHFKSSPL
jgi:hypothetical protein